MKALVLLLLAGIFISLFSGLFFLAKDKQNSTRLLNALRIRVGLSIILVVLLVSAFFLGWLENP
jgi:hypothetical protein